jgi:nucleoside-diphosphate-sugar epimerase
MATSAHPRSSPPADVHTGRTVLVTGASGVVGRALLPALRADGTDAMCLVRRRPVSGPGLRSVTGDLTKPRLGLSPRQYADLARSIDGIVHSAAVTTFNRTDGSLEATNIDGTRRVLDLAANAEVPIYHISSAYLNASADGERGRTAVGYAASKRAAEDLVRSSGLDSVILRPSVVIGDSATGDIAAFQGLYQVCGALLEGLLPIVPFDPTWPIDFIPQDVVASAIATVVRRDLRTGEYWVTAGRDALTLAQALESLLSAAQELRRPVLAPRFIPPEMFDRLVAPVFLDALPSTVRDTVVRLLEFFAAYLALESALPSSLDELAALGAQPLPDQRASLRNALHYWAEATGRTASAADSEACDDVA